MKPCTCMTVDSAIADRDEARRWARKCYRENGKLRERLIEMRTELLYTRDKITYLEYRLRIAESAARDLAEGHS